MKYVYVLLLVITVVGLALCVTRVDHKNNSYTNPMTSPGDLVTGVPLMSSQAIAVEKDMSHGVERLKTVAKKRHLYWEVICTSSDDPLREFQADASDGPNDGTWTADLEDHGIGFWSETGPTQQSAAYSLAELLESGVPKNIPSTHKPKRKQCPEPIYGGPESHKARSGLKEPTWLKDCKSGQVIQSDDGIIWKCADVGKIETAPAPEPGAVIHPM